MSDLLNYIKEKLLDRNAATEIDFEAMPESTQSNKGLPRTIKTLRTRKEIKSALKAGRKILKQEVKPSEEIRVTDIHIKDRLTWKVKIIPYDFDSLSLVPSGWRYKVVHKTYYPYSFPSKVAAYLLPDDLKVGERVILEDLIEDIVGASHAFGTYRLDSAEAVWNGERFIVDQQSYEVNVTFG
jgi:hypothetical protein